jgi:antitoxin PrlF
MKVATRLTSKGQVVIPKPVRDRFRWTTGTRLQVEARDDGAVVLRPEDHGGNLDSLIDQLSGCLASFEPDPLADMEAEHRAEIEADERRLGRRR